MKTANTIFNFYIHDLTLAFLADTVCGDNYKWNEYISSNRYRHIEKTSIKIISIVFSINAVIISAFLYTILYREVAVPTIAEAGTNVPLAYTNSNKITRPLFETTGLIVILDSDNYEVFEYKDSTEATETFSRVSQAFDNSTWLKADKQKVHLFIKDNLIFYYFGNDKKIIKTLSI